VSSTVNLVSDIFHGRWSEAWGEMKDIASAMIDLFIGYVKATFGNLPEIMYNAGRDAGNALVRGLKDAAGSVLDSVSVGGVSAKDALDFGSNLFRANGGPVTAGQGYIVGERGPEFFVPSQSGNIVPNGGGGVSIHIDKVYARDEAEARRSMGDIGFALSLRGATL